MQGDGLDSLPVQVSSLLFSALRDAIVDLNALCIPSISNLEPRGSQLGHRVSDLESESESIMGFLSS